MLENEVNINPKWVEAKPGVSVLFRAEDVNRGDESIWLVSNPEAGEIIPQEGGKALYIQHTMEKTSITYINPDAGLFGSAVAMGLSIP